MGTTTETPRPAWLPKPLPMPEGTRPDDLIPADAAPIVLGRPAAALLALETIRQADACDTDLEAALSGYVPAEVLDTLRTYRAFRLAIAARLLAGLKPEQRPLQTAQ